MSDIEKNIDDESEDGRFLTLTDDSGEDISFEVIDEFPYNGKNYVVLIPFEDLEDEVVILEAIYAENPEDNEYISVEDEELVKEVFEEFKNRNADEYDFD
ncbi:MAG: DUF1292 domain-containing protein [Oscillospiraceae bacterium]|nr:DUF1292 domain-containing protein [Oscillospiraceae bacterium]